MFLTAYIQLLICDMPIFKQYGGREKKGYVLIIKSLCCRVQKNLFLWVLNKTVLAFIQTLYKKKCSIDAIFDTSRSPITSLCKKGMGRLTMHYLYDLPDSVRANTHRKSLSKTACQL